MSVSIKKVEHDYHETGQTPSTRTDTEYVLGGDIDGVFVPFVTVAGGRVEMFKAQAEAEAEKEEASKASKPGASKNG